MKNNLEKEILQSYEKGEWESISNDIDFSPTL